MKGVSESLFTDTLKFLRFFEGREEDMVALMLAESRRSARRPIGLQYASTRPFARDISWDSR
jgi:hypothetical protein